MIFLVLITILCFSTVFGDPSIQEMIIKSELLTAVANGEESKVKDLIQNGANVNGAGETTALHIAILGGFDKIVDILLQNGADSNIVGDRGVKPLHVAAIANRVKIADLLLRNGARVDDAAQSGRTALHAAAYEGYQDVVDVLLNYNAKKDVKDVDGKTPADFATERGFPKIATLLRIGVAERACTIYSKSISDRIVGGELAEPGEFPWMAALGYVNQNYHISFDCGGTIISDYYILTAAHCTRIGRRPVLVRLGKTSLTEEGERRTENREIYEIIRHPNYSLTEKKNDIALIRVSERIWFTDLIRPACLQTDLRDEDPSVNLTVAGWGILTAQWRNKTDLLRKTDLVTMPLDQCNRTLLDFNEKGGNLKAFRNGISESQYCAYDPSGVRDSCEGDSGGPLQIYPLGSNMAKLVGIVSFGIGCGSPMPALYTRVASFTNWIESHVWPNGEIATPLGSS